jgi:putative multiple sugar transport system substrate-binding protein
MKKVSSLLLVLVLVVSMFTMAGCAKPAAPAAAPAEAAATAAPAAEGGKLIGVAMPTKSLQRWNQDGDNMKKMLEAAGYEVVLEYADNKVEQQVTQIENMVTKGCKAIVIASIDGTALKGVLADAAAEGIKVIAYDRLILDSPNVDYYATFDNYLVGKIQGDYIIKALGLDQGKGPFNMECFGGSPDDNNAFFFNNGAMDALKPYIESGKLVVVSGQTKMEQIAIQGWKSEGSQARMDNLLTAFYADKKLDVVLSPNDSLAQGIVASLKAAGFGTADKPFPVLTGQDCDIANVKMLIEGSQSMSIFKDTRTLADQVVKMDQAIMDGKEVPVNDTKTYNNNIKIVPSFLCEPVFADKNNYKALLVDTGYYTEDQLK